MKYAAAVLMLAIVCGHTHAQDFLSSSKSSSPEAQVISPLFVQSPSVMHLEVNKHPGSGKMLARLAAVGAGVGLIMWGANEVDRGEERVIEYQHSHPQRGLHPDGDGGGGYTIQFWGHMMQLGGASLTSLGVYLEIRGAVKRHRFNKQYKDDYSPMSVQPAPPMSVGSVRALRSKVSGIAMVGMGAALQITGTILYINGGDGSMDKLLGKAAFFAGTGLAVPGTLLWIKGARRQATYKDYPSIAPRASLGLRFGPMPSLCYRF